MSDLYPKYIPPEENNIGKFYKPTTRIFGSLKLPESNNQAFYDERNYTTILMDDTIFVIDYTRMYYSCVAINQMKLFYIHRDNFSHLLDEYNE